MTEPVASPQALTPPGTLAFRFLGRRPYEPVWREMQAFTDARAPETPDELWFVEHDPVFTLGQAGRLDHVLDPGETPVIRSDRGGQVTWHGPGQVVAYPLVDLRRRGLGIRSLVSALETAVIALLAEFGVVGAARPDAPGVYVDGCKIAAVGLRVRRGCSYHGVAVNVDNDLEPFTRIHPCGYPELRATRLRDCGVLAGPDEVRERLGRQLAAALHSA